MDYAQIIGKIRALTCASSSIKIDREFAMPDAFRDGPWFQICLFRLGEQASQPQVGTQVRPTYVIPAVMELPLWLDKIDSRTEVLLGPLATWIIGPMRIAVLALGRAC